MQKTYVPPTASSPPLVLPTGREPVLNRAGRPARDAAIIARHIVPGNWRIEQL